MIKRRSRRVPLPRVRRSRGKRVKNGDVAVRIATAFDLSNFLVHLHATGRGLPEGWWERERRGKLAEIEALARALKRMK